MAAYFAVPPPRGVNPHHGRHHLRPSDGAHAPRYHGPPRPMALWGHPAHGAYGGLQPGPNERTTLAMAPGRSPAHPGAMQRHNIWDIPGSPGYLGHASGQPRPRSQDILEPPRQTARRNSPERQRGAPAGMGSSAGTYRSPLRPFAPRRGQGSHHTSGMQGGTLEQRQETRTPSRSRRRSRTPPPAARRVVFHEDTYRGHGGPNDLHAQRTSNTTDPRRPSKSLRTERAHIPSIPTPAERERQAALHTGPHRAADGASSSSATSLLGSAAGPLPGGQHATDTRPREPKAHQGPAQGVGGQPPQHPPPPRARREDTGPRPGHRPPDQPGPCTTGFPTPAATRPNRQGAEDAPQQREHDASGPGAGAEIRET